MSENLSQNKLDAIMARAISLASAVFRVANSFAKQGFLQDKICEKSCDVVLAVNKLKGSDKNSKIWYNIRVEIQGIKALFEIAKPQNWIKSVNFDVLEQEYNELEKEIDSLMVESRNFFGLNGIKNAVKNGFQDQEEAGQFAESGRINRLENTNSDSRQTRILEYLKNNGRIQISRICQIFPEVSRRTLIRDMDELFKTGKIQRNGSGRGVSYQIQQQIQQQTSLV